MLSGKPDPCKYFVSQRGTPKITYDQTLFYNKELNQRGDCLRACIATLLDIKPETLPHSTHFSDYIEVEEIYWNYTGFMCVDSLDKIQDEEGIDGLFMAYGESSRGCYHAVIINKQGEIVHDPHPSKEGIKDIQGIWIIEPMEKAKTD